MQPALLVPGSKSFEITDIRSIDAHLSTLTNAKEVLNFYRFVFKDGAAAKGTPLSAINIEKLQDPLLKAKLHHLFTQKNIGLLHQAIHEKDVEVCEDMLTHHVAGATDRNSRDELPILLAKRVNEVAIARILFRYDVLESLSRLQATEMLPWLIEHNFVEQITKFIYKGYPLNTEDENGVRPIMLAASEANLSIFEALVNAGVDLFKPDKNGHRPIYFCCVLGIVDFIRILTEKGVRLHEVIQELPTSDQTRTFKDELLSISQANDEDLLNNLENVEKLQFIFMASDINRTLERFFIHLKTPLEQSVAQQIEQIYPLKHLPNWSELCKTKPRQIKQLNNVRCAGSQTLQANPVARERWETADRLIMQWAEQKVPLTLEKIAEINRLIDPVSAGIYREIGDEITPGGNFVKCYLLGHLVSEQMSQFLSKLELALQLVERRKINPIEFTARHYQFAISIHPFKNGNGRTCRFVADYLLRRCKLPPAAWGTDVDAAVFLYYPKNLFPSKVVSMVFSAVERSYQILSEGETHVDVP